MIDSHSPDDKSGSEPAEPSDSALAGAGPTIAIQSTDLLQGGREVTIVHGSESYRLRLTRMNKLILTK